MKVSYQWLKEFVDIQDDAQGVGRRLTGVGLTLDGLEAVGSDHVLELDVATNRPDCLSHVGVARELGVIYDTDLRLPQFELDEGPTETREIFSISIADPDLCGRYCGRYIAGVKIGPSPDWLKARLESLGQRSINNVADITNYVMLEMGQPLHAFDADTLQGRRIIVRRAELDEQVTTLDGVVRILNPSTLLIADANRGVAIAGVMGGTETEISTGTKNVLLESACFNPLSIRKTSRTLGLSSEASYRFERGTDIVQARLVCDRAAALIQQTAGGTVYRHVIDVYPGETRAAAIRLRAARIQGFLGAPVDDAIVERIFKRLGFAITNATDGWTLVAPSHRIDMSIEEDLLEEIARHHGYDKFPFTLPSFSGYGSGLPTESDERLLRDHLYALGYSEVISMAFSDAAAESRFRPDVEPLRLLNPMAENEAVLRTSLLPSMMRTLEWNLNRGMRDLQLYELGKSYRKGSESRALLLAATGAMRVKSVHEQENIFDFYDLKGGVEDILEFFGVNLTTVRENLPAYYHPGRAARFGDVAVFGELHPEFTEQIKPKQRIYIAEIDIERLLAAKGRRQIAAVPRFPSIRRDLSLLVDKDRQYEDIHRSVISASIPELVQIEPFDRMETGSFPETKYSISISLIYQSAVRTLTDDEVDKFDQQILSLLEQRVGAQLRK
jgi:phenylalanyl-tRNA synthetase beta chain